MNTPLCVTKLNSTEELQVSKKACLNVIPPKARRQEYLDTNYDQSLAGKYYLALTASHALSWVGFKVGVSPNVGSWYGAGEHWTVASWGSAGTAVLSHTTESPGSWIKKKLWEIMRWKPNVLQSTNAKQMSPFH